MLKFKAVNKNNEYDAVGYSYPYGTSSLSLLPSVAVRWHL